MNLFPRGVSLFLKEKAYDIFLDNRIFKDFLRIRDFSVKAREFLPILPSLVPTPKTPEDRLLRPDQSLRFYQIGQRAQKAGYGELPLRFCRGKFASLLKDESFSAEQCRFFPH